MIFVENENHFDAKLNLALEEYVLRNFSPLNDYLLFYINAPAIIIGRNQNTLEEINQQYIVDNNIEVVRRISGGGAVYHDQGNLNFSFITNHDSKQLSNFKKFTAPVIKVLNELGLKAELKGRNDIQVAERKISGTAQFTTGKRMVSHGTLLFDANLGEVANALNVKMSKIQSKGHKSVRSRVANITEFLKEPISIAQFQQILLQGLYEEEEPFEHYRLTALDWEGVRQLKASKYDTWEWNYGQSPKFNIQRSRRFAIGEIDLRIMVEDGRITSFKVYGDFFGNRSVAELESLFVGLRYEKIAIERVIFGIDLSEFFGDLTFSEFSNLVYGDDEE